jgi:hypothetical protein
MIWIDKALWVWMGLMAYLGVIPGVARAQAKKKQPEVAARGAKALIDRLTEVDEQDTGYSRSVSGSSFLPLGRSETHMILLGQKPHAASDALASLE